KQVNCHRARPEHEPGMPTRVGWRAELRPRARPSTPVPRSQNRPNGESRVRPAAFRSELVERRLFVTLDLEELVEPGDAKGLEQIGVDAAELELPFDGGDFLLEVDQLA